MLPEAKLAAVGIFETGERSSRLFPYRSCRHSPRVQLAGCLTDVSDPRLSRAWLVPGG